jgi:TolB-like protein
VDAALRRALAKTPADRFASAAAFAQALAEPGARRVAVVPVRKPRQRRFAILGALGAGLAIVVGLWLTHMARRGGTDPKRVLVAVLANRTGNPALDPLGLTAADYINRGLLQTGLVEVVDVGVLYVQGRAATGEPAEPRALARRNGAGIVVTGSYDQSGDSLVFLASIVDAGSGRVLQALEPVRGPLARRELALDALRQRVTVGLAMLLDPRLSELTTLTPEPPNYAAYQAFVAGQSAGWSGNDEEAMAQFRQAARLDSTFLTAAVLGGNGSMGCRGTARVRGGGRLRRSHAPAPSRPAHPVGPAPVGRHPRSLSGGLRNGVAHPEPAPASPGSLYAVSNAAGGVHPAGGETARGRRHSEATRP